MNLSLAFPTAELFINLAKFYRERELDKYYTREIIISELDKSFVYDIDRPLGRGSFGIVYKCREVSLTKYSYVMFTIIW